MNNSEAGINFLDVRNRLTLDEDKAVIRRSQDLGNHFLSNLATRRTESANAPMGDMHHVASIPTVIVEKWMAEGFNIFDPNVNIKEVVKRLNSEDMTGLMATSKNVL